jgi:hypothetical protein
LTGQSAIGIGFLDFARPPSEDLSMKRAVVAAVLVALGTVPAGAWQAPDAMVPVPMSVPTPRYQPKAQSIDELISKLTTLKAQKAELEKQEKELLEVLKTKLKEQKARLKKLGVDVEENNTPPSSSIGLRPTCS